MSLEAKGTRSQFFTTEGYSASSSSRSIRSICGLDSLSTDLGTTNDQSPVLLVTFHSHTSGDIDGAHITFNTETPLPSHVLIKGTIDGYVKVGNPSAGNPHKSQPNFQLEASWDEIIASGEKSIQFLGGFVRTEAIPSTPLPMHVQGNALFTGKRGEERAIYVVGREWSDDKVVTSAVFVSFS